MAVPGPPPSPPGPSPGPSDWFRHWFGPAYRTLYRRRDPAQARRQVEAVLGCAAPPAGARALDVGCGGGRHVLALRDRGLRAVGLDLSPTLLSDARAAGLPVARGDMRRLPFAPGAFALVTCFFTSFGYFADAGEDARVLAGFAAALAPGGWLFLDLINPAHLRRHLVAEDMIEAEGLRARQRRRLEGDMVVKEIELEGPDGRRETYCERVRLYARGAVEALAAPLGLETRAAFGDEGGGPFDPEASPRLGLLFRKSRPGGGGPG